MRVGVLTRGESGQLEWAKRLGFRSIEWVAFADSLAGPDHKEWKPFADTLAGEAEVRDIRISAIGALYQNPLDPKQTDHARAVFHRAIEVASHLGIKTVAGFCGAVIKTHLNERGGNLVQEPVEKYLPQV